MIISMNDNQMVEQNETAVTPVKKIDSTGLSYYGEKFTTYMKIGELNDLIPVFKDYYYDKRIKEPTIGLTKVVKAFNEDVSYPQDKKFHPYTSQLRLWVRKWNADILEQQFQMKEEGKDLQVMQRKHIQQIIKTRNDEGLILSPDDNSLEAGVRTLGGELLNDAMQMLKDDQALDEVYEDDTLIKRRNYIVGVFGHVNKLVQGKAALMLKASEEKRNNAGFIVNLIEMATSGKLSDEKMAMLRTTYQPKKDEQQTQV